MKIYFISFIIVSVLLCSCKKKDNETEPQFPLANTAWEAINKNGMPVSTNADKEYLFFSNKELDNYYDFTSAACFKAETSKYELIADKLKLTFDDSSIEENDWLLNKDGTLKITFNYSISDKDINIYQKTTVKKSEIKRCN